MPLTVTKLARACRLSRSTLLYYESLGLLPKPHRTAGNYRAYSEKDLERLRQICIYRDAGVPLRDIRSILSAPSGDASAILRRRLVEMSAEIGRMREQQRAIARLLKKSYRWRNVPMVTKEKWVAVMRSAGFTEGDMQRWHAEFEKSAPTEHQEFLEFLHIPEKEVSSIREWSRKGGAPSKNEN
jgi:MerR family transcriptional regulator, thiopeptide resistance regulator